MVTKLSRLSEQLRLAALHSRLGSVEEIDEALVGGALHLLGLRTILVHLESGHALDAGGL